MMTDIECPVKRLLCWICHLTRDQQDFLVYLHIVLARVSCVDGKSGVKVIESYAVYGHCLVDLTQLLSDTDSTFGAYGEVEEV
jgi:hypothetical protein